MAVWNRIKADVTGCQGRTRVVHPLVKALRELETQIAGTAGQLGFSPAARR